MLQCNDEILQTKKHIATQLLQIEQCIHSNIETLFTTYSRGYIASFNILEVQNTLFYAFTKQLQLASVVPIAI